MQSNNTTITKTREFNFMNVITDNLGIGVPPPLVHLASSFRVNEFHSFTWPAFLERYEEMQRSPQISQTGLPDSKILYH